MIVVANRLRMPVEYADHLQTAFRQRGNLRDQPGFVAFQLLKLAVSREDRAEYVVSTTWTDRASYEAWVASDAFSKAHAGAGSASPVQSELEIYEVVQHAP